MTRTDLLAQLGDRMPATNDALDWIDDCPTVAVTAALKNDLAIIQALTWLIENHTECEAERASACVYRNP